MYVLDIKVIDVFCCLLPGISGKSQILFALVFTTRYLDLLTSFISLYNTTMKVKKITHFSSFSHTVGAPTPNPRAVSTQLNQVDTPPFAKE